MSRCHCHFEFYLFNYFYLFDKKDINRINSCAHLSVWLFIPESISTRFCMLRLERQLLTRFRVHIAGWKRHKIDRKKLWNWDLVSSVCVLIPLPLEKWESVHLRGHSCWCPTVGPPEAEPSVVWGGCWWWVQLRSLQLCLLHTDTHVRTHMNTLWICATARAYRWSLMSVWRILRKHKCKLLSCLQNYGTVALILLHTCLVRPLFTPDSTAVFL